MTAVADPETVLIAELIDADPVLVGNDALLSAVFAASGDCIKVLDLDGRLQFMSEGGKRVMEVDDFAALKGCPWPSFWEGEGNVEAERAIVDARNGKTARFMGPANTAKGNPRFWDVRVLPIVDRQGKPTHLLSISTDITESRAVELAGRESQLQAKLALAAAELGVWQCRVVDGTFFDLVGDDRALTLLGGTPGTEASFTDFVARIAPEDRAKLAPAAARAVDPDGDGILDVEYRMLGRNGAADTWVHARAQALASSVGHRLIGTVRDITESKDAEARQALLSGELQHRIKNTLAMVNAIATQTLKGDDIADRRTAFSARLDALAKAHDILTATTWRSAPILSVVEGALSPHLSDGDRVSLEGPNVGLTARQALSMSLTIHELATNAAKYGALSVPGGSVDIEWNLTDTEFTFVWREIGGPNVVEPIRKGFGSRMINRVLAADFEGEVRIDYASDGVVCTLASPASRIGSEQSVSSEQKAAR